MSNSASQKAAVAGVWDRAANAFGRVGPGYWDYFGGRLAEISDIIEGQHILDIGCGRGASLFPAARLTGISGAATGIDISSGMVENAIIDAKSLNLDNVAIMQMDADDMSFQDNSFDRVLNGFGLGFLLDKEYKISEVYRLLKPSGQVCICSWAKQEDTAWLTGIVSKYIPPSTPTATPITQPTPPRTDIAEGIEEILTSTGFRDVQTTYEEKTFTYRDEVEWWQEMWANAVRGILEKIQEKGPDQLEAFKQEAFSGLINYKDSKGIHFKRSVYLAKGTK